MVFLHPTRPRGPSMTPTDQLLILPPQGPPICDERGRSPMSVLCVALSFDEYAEQLESLSARTSVLTSPEVVSDFIDDAPRQMIDGAFLEAPPFVHHASAEPLSPGWRVFALFGGRPMLASRRHARRRRYDR